MNGCGRGNKLDVWAVASEIHVRRYKKTKRVYANRAASSE